MDTSRPDVHFFCNVDFDPFLYMEDNNKVYGEHLQPLRPPALTLLRLHDHNV